MRKAGKSHAADQTSASAKDHTTEDFWAQMLARLDKELGLKPHANITKEVK